MRAIIFWERVGFLVVIYTIHVKFLWVKILPDVTFDFSKRPPHFRCKIFLKMCSPVDAVTI